MSKPVPEIWAARIAEQSLEFEGQVNSKNLSGLREIYQTAKPIFILNAMLVEISGLHSSGFKVPANHVFDLWHEEVYRPDKITIIAKKKPPSKEILASLWDNRGLTSHLHKIVLPYVMFYRYNL